VPKYKVVLHRRVGKFINNLKDENLKNTITNNLAKLENYPITLREMDIEKIKGLERTFRIRIGKHRIIFHVDKTEKTVYITHAETRKKAYTKLGKTQKTTKKY
jgi:mRNA-degrading endonuclease RelE of RelBE toxin-antitoxin system